MTKVTNPPGTACYTYGSCDRLLKAEKKINYQGASGNLDYNRFNNTFGPYGAFQSTATGLEKQLYVMSANALAVAIAWPGAGPRRPPARARPATSSRPPKQEGCDGESPARAAGRPGVPDLARVLARGGGGGEGKGGGGEGGRRGRGGERGGGEGGERGGGGWEGGREGGRIGGRRGGEEGGVGRVDGGEGWGCGGAGRGGGLHR